jgi:hypothetical protein
VHGCTAATPASPGLQQEREKWGTIPAPSRTSGVRPPYSAPIWRATAIERGGGGPAVRAVVSGGFWGRGFLVAQMGETLNERQTPVLHKRLYTSPDKHWNDKGMNAIPRKYITDAKNQKQAVIVDLETFNRMESIIEDNGLAKFMEEAEEDETLFVHEAKKHYRSLKKD